MEKTSSKSWNSLGTDLWKDFGGAKFFAKDSDNHCEVVALALMNSTGSWIVVIKPDLWVPIRLGHVSHFLGLCLNPPGSPESGLRGPQKLLLQRAWILSYRSVNVELPFGVYKVLVQSLFCRCYSKQGILTF